MKADKYGTYSEQIMWRIGYKTGKERLAAGVSDTCSGCTHMGLRPGFPKPRCIKNDLAITITATCNEWEEK